MSKTLKRDLIAVIWTLLVTYAIGKWAFHLAYIERGYEAVGGEYLLIPVTRTRARSGKGTLNISQFVENEWKDCSKERYNDTQQEILNILGMDSFTFKSCALIMQDQYGLFLQAKPEENLYGYDSWLFS